MLNRLSEEDGPLEWKILKLPRIVAFRTRNKRDQDFADDVTVWDVITKHFPSPEGYSAE